MISIAEFEKLQGPSYVADEIVAPVANAEAALDSKMIDSVKSVEHKIPDSQDDSQHEQFPPNQYV